MLSPLTTAERELSQSDIYRLANSLLYPAKRRDNATAKRRKSVDAQVITVPTQAKFVWLPTVNPQIRG